MTGRCLAFCFSGIDIIIAENMFDYHPVFDKTKIFYYHEQKKWDFQISLEAPMKIRKNL